MSMYDPTLRARQDPLRSTRNFIENEPFVKPSTFSGSFQPAINDFEDPMSLSEQAALEVEELRPDYEEADQQDNYLVQFAQQQQQRRQRQEPQAASGGVEQYGPGGSSGGFATTDRGTGANLGNLSQSRQQVVRSAASYAGTPYQLGGRSAKGIDCSGLVMAVYNQAGFNVSQHSASWQRRNIPGVKTSLNNLQPGDIVAWKDGSHIAIYAGNGMIWDASRSKGTSLRKIWAPSSQLDFIKLAFPGER